MNEQLIKFIELCLMDGVVSDKEREVIFRKSIELGVPEDECEIILEGMIQKHQKENQINTSIPIPNKEEKLVEHKINIPENNFEIPSDYLLKKIFYKDYIPQKKEIDEKLKLLRLRNKETISDKKNQNQIDKNNIEKQFIRDEYELIKKSRELQFKFHDQTFSCFKKLYIESPILFQSSLFSSLLSSTKIDNEKQILNLTRYNKYIHENEINYDENIDLLFKKIKKGGNHSKEVELLLEKRKNLITYYNSFHIMLISLQEDKIGTYMDVYVELESLGIFNSFFEKSVLEKLTQLNETVIKIDNRLRLVNSQLSKTNNYLSILNKHMYNMNIQIGEISNKLNTLEDISYSIKEGNNLMREGNELLKDVRSGIRFNNLISSIQTYQLYKINKNTRGLRE
jgi:hypothetical protein